MNETRKNYEIEAFWIGVLIGVIVGAFLGVYAKGETLPSLEECAEKHNVYECKYVAEPIKTKRKNQ